MYERIFENEAFWRFKGDLRWVHLGITNMIRWFGKSLNAQSWKMQWGLWVFRGICGLSRNFQGKYIKGLKLGFMVNWQKFWNDILRVFHVEVWVIWGNMWEMSEKIGRVENLRFLLDSWGFGDWGWVSSVGSSLLYWIWSVCEVFRVKLMLVWELKIWGWGFVYFSWQLVFLWRKCIFGWEFGEGVN